MSDIEKALFKKYKWTIEDIGSPIQRAMWIVELEKCIHEAYVAGWNIGWKEAMEKKDEPNKCPLCGNTDRYHKCRGVIISNY